MHSHFRSHTHTHTHWSSCTSQNRFLLSRKEKILSAFMFVCVYVEYGPFLVVYTPFFLIFTPHTALLVRGNKKFIFMMLHYIYMSHDNNNTHTRTYICFMSYIQCVCVLCMHMSIFICAKGPKCVYIKVYYTSSIRVNRTVHSKSA